MQAQHLRQRAKSTRRPEAQQKPRTKGSRGRSEVAALGTQPKLSQNRFKFSHLLLGLSESGGSLAGHALVNSRTGSENTFPYRLATRNKLIVCGCLCAGYNVALGVKGQDRRGNVEEVWVLRLCYVCSLVFLRIVITYWL